MTIPYDRMPEYMEAPRLTPQDIAQASGQQLDQRFAPENDELVVFGTRTSRRVFSTTTVPSFLIKLAALSVAANVLTSCGESTETPLPPGVIPLHELFLEPEKYEGKDLRIGLPFAYVMHGTAVGQPDLAHIDYQDQTDGTHSTDKAYTGALYSPQDVGPQGPLPFFMFAESDFDSGKQWLQMENSNQSAQEIDARLVRISKMVRGGQTIQPSGDQIFYALHLKKIVPASQKL